MSLSIAKDFRFFSLLRFALPTMIMMVFTSLYTIVDGIFISRFVGSNALSSANIVFPVINLIIAVGVMFASGGSALIAKKLGEHKEKEANQDLSLIIATSLFLSVVILAAGTLFLEPVVRLSVQQIFWLQTVKAISGCCCFLLRPVSCSCSSRPSLSPQAGLILD